jgi:hypothetical protein
LHLGGSSNQTIQVEGASNTAYFGTNGDRNDIFVNYNPTDGAIPNSGRSTAGIQLDGAGGGSNIRFRTSNANNAASVEAMRIDSSGNVGIGTDSSTSLAHTLVLLDDMSVITQVSSPNNTSGGVIKLGATGQTGAACQAEIQVHRGSDSNTGDLSFSTANGSSVAEAMRIDSSGNMFVGKTASDQDTVGCELLGNGKALFTASNAAPLILNRTTQGGAIANFNREGVNVGNISVTNSATAYNTSSDYRLKEDWVPMSGASERVQALKPVNFAWKIDGSRVDGFLAHELQEVIPEAATGTKDAMQDEEYEVTPAVLDSDGNEISPAVMGTRSVPDMQGIDQSKIVPLLTAALQEALTKISTMEARLVALES